MENRLVKLILKRDVLDSVCESYRLRTESIPFSTEEIRRFRWGLPSFVYGLLNQCLKARGKLEEFEEPICDIYKQQLNVPSTIIRIGDLIITKPELDGLKKLKVFKKGFLESFENIRVDSNELLRVITVVRLLEYDLAANRFKNQASGDPSSSYEFIDILSGELRTKGVLLILSTQIISAITGKYGRATGSTENDFVEEILEDSLSAINRIFDD